MNESAGSSSSSGGGDGTFIWAVCGNGAIEQNEECDDGNKTSGDGCSKTCHSEETLHFSADDVRETVCGNGVLEIDEQCDDGNLRNGDGCNDFCESEDFVEEEKIEEIQEEKIPTEEIENVNPIFQIAECGN